MPKLLKKIWHLQIVCYRPSYFYTGTGYYVYIEASSPRQLNDKARLVSAQLTVTTPKCLHFWYHMYGTHVNTLNVYVKIGASLGTPVWTHTGTLSNKWYSADVNVQVCGWQLPAGYLDCLWLLLSMFVASNCQLVN